MEKPEIITSIQTRTDFGNLLVNNPGVIVIKFGASWCGPCKNIQPALTHYINQMPSNVQVCIIDIDECFDFYSFLQSKRMVNGVPAVLAYYKENTSYIPDASVIGADLKQIEIFFNKVFQYSKTLV
jgi:thiol-disulfide isomerase/thioredoxin